MNTDRFLSKAKRLDNCEWINGYYFHIKPYHKIHAFQCDRSLHNIDPSTLCQCTGLEDKNGKLIFDGDILVIDGEKYDMVYDIGTWWCHILGGEENECVYPEEATRGYVIGNIHDKKEEVER